MTNEEAQVFLDNLKICVKEHPIVADWLVEIANRKTEPTQNQHIQSVESVGEDRKTENSSEKPNNSTISKMEQVEDEPLTCSFSDCDNFKNPDYARCIECKRKQIEPKTEPQTERSE